MVVSMDRWVGKVAVVTGASSGIGAGIAESLVKAGLKVVGLARRKEKVEELSKKLQGSKGKLYAVKADITKEADIISAFEWTKNNLGPVHILINNAGIGTNTNLVEGDTEKWRKILDTNVLGLCIATREAIKSMRANNVDGHIVHINSITGHKIVYMPFVNVYGASKYAVTALTETLRQELNSIGSKIKITSVSPGFVRSEGIEAAGFEFAPEVLKAMEAAAMDPEDIADAVLYALATPPHVQVHELIVQGVGLPI